MAKKVVERFDNNTPRKDPNRNGTMSDAKEERRLKNNVYKPVSPGFGGLAQAM